MKFSTIFAATVILSVSSFILTSPAKAGCAWLDITCSSSGVRKFGRKIDPVTNRLYACNQWWNCDFNQMQMNAVVIAAKKSGIVSTREQCYSYVRKAVGEAEKQLDGLPILNTFLRRAISQGNDSCVLQFSTTSSSPQPTVTAARGISIWNETPNTVLYVVNGEQILLPANKFSVHESTSGFFMSYYIASDGIKNIGFQLVPGSSNVFRVNGNLVELYRRR